jgi:hypothetical protein
MIGRDAEGTPIEEGDSMQDDDRARRDWPRDEHEDASGEPSPPPAEESAPAEIESWPSQDASTADDSTAAPATPAMPEGEPDWPVEPPSPATADDTWSSAPSEPEPAPAAEPEPAPAAEAPPSEVEAYSSAPAVDDDAAVAAAAHTVPAAESVTGESTQCPRCGTENRPGLAFCRNCGQRLVAAGSAATIERPGTPEGSMACPRCGTHNRTGVAFCQNCGANLRGTAPGYVPPAMVAGEAAEPSAPARRGAVLGPVVLLIGLVGMITAYLLPFALGSSSLFERAFGSGGYGAAFWTAYGEAGSALADQAYFGLAAPVPLLGLLLLALAVGGFMRAAPGRLHTIGLVITLLWSLGLIIGFVLVELAANWDGDLVGLLRVLSPAGIIFFLAGLIAVIGVLTRFGRS